MIDGLTFGVAAGAAYAAAETIVVNRELFSDFGHVDSPNAGFWVSLILSAAVVKPIVYGAATGIAVASYSGLGAGYDGFKPGYFRGLAEALIANIAFQAGLFFSARIEGTTGAVIGLVWGALIAAALVVRLRYLLHFAVLEAALEAAATGGELKDTAHGTAYCPSCEMPLLPGANFCVACGTSARAGSKVTRTRNRVDDTAPVLDEAGEPVVAAPVRPSLKPTPEGVAPQDNKRTALVVGVVAATIVVAGVIGQCGRRGRRRRAAAAEHLADRPADPGRLRSDHRSGSDAGPGARAHARRVRGCVVEYGSVRGQGLRPALPGRPDHGSVQRGVAVAGHRLRHRGNRGYRCRHDHRQPRHSAGTSASTCPTATRSSSRPTGSSGLR